MTTTDDFLAVAMPDGVVGIVLDVRGLLDAHDIAQLTLTPAEARAWAERLLTAARLSEQNVTGR